MSGKDDLSYYFEQYPDVGLKTLCCGVTVRGKRVIVARCSECGRYAKVIKPGDEVVDKGGENG